MLFQKISCLTDLNIFAQNLQMLTMHYKKNLSSIFLFFRMFHIIKLKENKIMQEIFFCWKFFAYYKMLSTWFGRVAVYFNQWIGAVHLSCWSKFCCFVISHHLSPYFWLKMEVCKKFCSTTLKRPETRIRFRTPRQMVA